MWNNPGMDIQWLGLKDKYLSTASAEGYLQDGQNLKLSHKDLKWLGLKDTFHFADRREL